jgi:protocatechuate 3,4-dioxygenase beta subunit
MMPMSGYRHDDDAIHPPHLYPDYRSTTLRAPSRPLIPLAHTLSEITGPIFGPEDVGPLDHDLTRQHEDEGQPIGQRIIVAGRVLDGDGTPIPGTLIEVWQANAAGRYAHREDQHDAPLDPAFTGGGRCITDEDGTYRFVTIQPGAYPWQNHPNAWRPAHIHFSLFGPAVATRLITQMYFEGDPLIPYDPILQSVPDEAARQRLVAAFDMDLTEPGWALGYRFDIVLRGRDATPFEA